MNHQDAMEPCARVRGRIEALCDGSLPALEQARDEGHLEACAECAREAERQRAWLADVRAHLAPSAAELASATRGLDARIAAVRVSRRSREWKLAGAAAVAAAAMLALTALQALRVSEVDLAQLLARASEATRTEPWPSLRGSWGGWWGN